MIFKKIHLGKVSYTHEYFDEVSAILKAAYTAPPPPPAGQHYPGHKRDGSTASTTSITVERRHFQRHLRVDSYEVDRDTVYRVQQAVLALALCHNVTPSCENETLSENSLMSGESLEMQRSLASERSDSVVIPLMPRGITYQASSPDEVALVQVCAFHLLNKCKSSLSARFLH